jgi:adenine-specific DNA-methyltransferase
MVDLVRAGRSPDDLAREFEPSGHSIRAWVAQADRTSTKVVERCLLMTTDPGDLVLDPTCGSGTTAYVAE